MSIKSYFNPEVVKTFESNINTDIQLVEFSGHIRLDMGGLTQSGLVIEKIWGKAFRKLLPRHAFPKNILILGLGAGSVVKVINKKWPTSQITGVEIDPVVIGIAKKYFNLDKISNLKIINQDAQLFLKKIKNKNKYDLILIDCYQGYKIPAIFEKIQFLRQISKIGKTVLINRLFWDEHKSKTIKFLAKLRDFFTVFTCRTPSNLIISMYNNSDVPETKKLFPASH